MKLFITPLAPNGTDRRVNFNGSLISARTQIQKPARKPRRQVIKIGSAAAFELTVGKKTAGQNARERVILQVDRSSGSLKIKAKEFMRKRPQERSKILRYSKSSKALSIYRQGHIIRILFEPLS
jgi:hypothetical protein